MSADVLHLVPPSASSGGPHRRSQSEVPGYQDDEAHCDPFTDISDALPQKYATLPRNRNPFEGEHGQLWDPAERKEKKEKVRLLERVTGKKDGRKTSNGGRLGSAGDLRAPNPFSGELPADTNPFISNYKPRSPALYFISVNTNFLFLIFLLKNSESEFTGSKKRIFRLEEI